MKVFMLCYFAVCAWESSTTPRQVQKTFNPKYLCLLLGRGFCIEVCDIKTNNLYIEYPPGTNIAHESGWLEDGIPWMIAPAGAMLVPGRVYHAGYMCVYIYRSRCLVKVYMQMIPVVFDNLHQLGW